jgi:hypothetical protein
MVNNRFEEQSRNGHGRRMLQPAHPNRHLFQLGNVRYMGPLINFLPLRFLTERPREEEVKMGLLRK